MVLLVTLCLFLIIPAAAFAEVDHSSHGTPVIDNSPVSKENLKTNSLTEQKGAATEDSGHQSQETGGHESSGHGGGNPPKSSLEPVKNQVVAGFLGLNVFVVIAAAVMKGKKRAGGVHCG
jgi:hypothetical protein